MPPKRRQKHSPSASIDDDQMEDTNEEETKKILPKAKSDFVREVEQLKRAIRKKDDFKEKLKNPVIVGRYKEEAIAQGATAEAIDVAIEELNLFEVDETRFDFDDIVSDKCITHKDKVIPEELRLSLEKNLDALANKPNPDFHPGSDGQVQDLIHPSLFPYIKGVSSYRDSETGEMEIESFTPVQQSPERPKSSWMRTYRKKEIEGHDRWDRPIEKSKYQWLPATYSISKDNKVKITSYINNLDRDEHPEIYENCEQIFETLLPHIDKIVKRALNSHFRDRADDDYVFQENSSIDEEQEEEQSDDEDPNNNPIKFKGNRKYLVITKACNYILKPGDSYEGNWHIEGMTHEHILASVLYYYSSSPSLKDTGLAFRADGGYSDDYGPSGKREWEKSVNLGTIRTIQDRVIMFSNEYQHKVTLLENSSETETAYRKILCFFIVDPEGTVKTSEEVPIQQWSIIRKKLIKTMLLVLKKKQIKLPKEILLNIVDFAKSGLTWKEAEEHRLELMKERKFFRDEMNAEMERSFSLCEH